MSVNTMPTKQNDSLGKQVSENVRKRGEILVYTAKVAEQSQASVFGFLQNDKRLESLQFASE